MRVFEGKKVPLSLLQENILTNIKETILISLPEWDEDQLDEYVAHVL